MFIAPDALTILATQEGNITCPLRFRSLELTQLFWRPLVYKHFVPTGLRWFSNKLFCHHGQGQYNDRTLPTAA